MSTEMRRARPEKSPTSRDGRKPACRVGEASGGGRSGSSSIRRRGAASSCILSKEALGSILQRNVSVHDCALPSLQRRSSLGRRPKDIPFTAQVRPHRLGQQFMRMRHWCRLPPSTACCIPVLQLHTNLTVDHTCTACASYAAKPSRSGRLSPSADKSRSCSGGCSQTYSGDSRARKSVWPSVCALKAESCRH
jgi:hypothetical protein